MAMKFMEKLFRGGHFVIILLFLLRAAGLVAMAVLEL